LLLIFDTKINNLISREDAEIIVEQFFIAQEDLKLIRDLQNIYYVRNNSSTNSQEILLKSDRPVK